MHLHNKAFDSPYFIFINKGFKMTDEELLKELDLRDYQLTLEDTERKSDKLNKKRCLFITEDSDWTHLMDDWKYTLWHDENFRIRVEKLSKNFDIFCCSFGDCDDSFDFCYYRDGVLVREYIVKYSSSKGVKVVKNFGKPLKSEALLLKEKDASKLVLSIAQSIGININHNIEKVRFYTRPENQLEEFFFDESEY